MKRKHYLLSVEIGGVENYAVRNLACIVGYKLSTDPAKAETFGENIKKRWFAQYPSGRAVAVGDEQRPDLEELRQIKRELQGPLREKPRKFGPRMPPKLGPVRPRAVKFGPRKPTQEERGVASAQRSLDMPREAEPAKELRDNPIGPDPYGMAPIGGFKTYEEAKKFAVAQVREFRSAHGIEKPTAYQGWTVKGLPMKKNRFGFESRIEALEPEDYPPQSKEAEPAEEMVVYGRGVSNTSWPISAAQKFRKLAREYWDGLSRSKKEDLVARLNFTPDFEQDRTEIKSSAMIDSWVRRTDLVAEEVANIIRSSPEFLALHAERIEHNRKVDAALKYDRSLRLSGIPAPIRFREAELDYRREAEYFWNSLPTSKKSRLAQAATGKGTLTFSGELFKLKKGPRPGENWNGDHLASILWLAKDFAAFEKQGERDFQSVKKYDAEKREKLGLTPKLADREDAPLTTEKFGANLRFAPVGTIVRWQVPNETSKRIYRKMGGGKFDWKEILPGPHGWRPTSVRGELVLRNIIANYNQAPAQFSIVFPSDPKAEVYALEAAEPLKPRLSEERQILKGGEGFATGFVGPQRDAANNDESESLNHAQNFLAILKAQLFLGGRVWQKSGVGTRVYLRGDSYLSFTRGGDLFKTTRGVVTYLPSSFRLSERQAIQAAIKIYNKGREERIEEISNADLRQRDEQKEQEKKAGKAAGLAWAESQAEKKKAIAVEENILAIENATTGTILLEWEPGDNLPLRAYRKMGPDKLEWREIIKSQSASGWKFLRAREGTTNSAASLFRDMINKFRARPNRWTLLSIYDAGGRYDMSRDLADRYTKPEPGMSDGEKAVEVEDPARMRNFTKTLSDVSDRVFWDEFHDTAKSYRPAYERDAIAAELAKRVKRYNGLKGRALRMAGLNMPGAFITYADGIKTGPYLVNLPADTILQVSGPPTKGYKNPVNSLYILQSDGTWRELKMTGWNYETVYAGGNTLSDVARKIAAAKPSEIRTFKSGSKEHARFMDQASSAADVTPAVVSLLREYMTGSRKKDAPGGIIRKYGPIDFHLLTRALSAKLIERADMNDKEAIKLTDKGRALL